MTETKLTAEQAVEEITKRLDKHDEDGGYTVADFVNGVRVILSRVQRPDCHAGISGCWCEIHQVYHPLPTGNGIDALAEAAGERDHAQNCLCGSECNQCGKKDVRPAEDVSGCFDEFGDDDCDGTYIPYRDPRCSPTVAPLSEDARGKVTATLSLLSEVDRYICQTTLVIPMPADNDILTKDGAMGKIKELLESALSEPAPTMPSRERLALLLCNTWRSALPYFAGMPAATALPDSAPGWLAVADAVLARAQGWKEPK